jgi:hypothetical protein
LPVLDDHDLGRRIDARHPHADEAGVVDKELAEAQIAQIEQRARGAHLDAIVHGDRGHLQHPGRRAEEQLAAVATPERPSSSLVRDLNLPGSVRQSNNEDVLPSGPARRGRGVRSKRVSASALPVNRGGSTLMATWRSSLASVAR